MTTNQQLEQALHIAIEAHQGQVDKLGMPYILHPIEVMTRVYTVEEKIVALLHDVVEDTDMTFADLIRRGINTDLVAVVVLLTREKSEDYQTYIQHLAPNPIARVVKLADLSHNTDLTRLPSNCKKDMERIEKYKKAIEFLRKY